MKSSSIDRIMVGPNNPHNNNTLWVDTSDGEKNAVLKYKGNPLVGGGGVGTSNATESDVNKVWQVTPMQKGIKTEETVIVPEQTLVNNQKLEYNDKFVPGAQCVAVIDGVEYRGEVVGNKKDDYVFEVSEYIEFRCSPNEEIFIFWNETESPEVTASLSIIEETPIYDYNWAPGVKIPIPTAEDEGKILVVTKVPGNNTSIIVPEQPVPVDIETPLTDVDMTKFVVGNIVKVTITYEENDDEPIGPRPEPGGKGPLKGAESANSQTFIATSVITDAKVTCVLFYMQELDNFFLITETENYLTTNIPGLGLSNPTIKLEYIEPNYEYQLQENSGGSGSTSNVLWPAMYEYNENEIIATFVPEDVEPNTWCMVCGAINDVSIDTCLPVFITSFGEYVLCNNTGGGVGMTTYSTDGGNLLRLSAAGGK